MSTKRKLGQDDDDNDNDGAEGYGGARATHMSSKSANLGQAVDAVSKTQMLLKFGQRLQAQKSRAAKQVPEPEPANGMLCPRCPTAGKRAAVTRCSYCCCALCAGCQQQCCCCGQMFCPTCSTLDYAEHETRAVCLDCSI
ncbi:hypothetical protein GGF42_007141 [Coemansia sp. RSA 2424]|nr:hypothetical protein GGF42_007141 [Coemansia sp. RSA 2424]